MASDVAREIWKVAKRQEAEDSEVMHLKTPWGEWRDVLKSMRDGVHTDFDYLESAI